MDLNTIALILFALSMVIFALFSVISRSLIKAAISLAVCSLSLTAVLFWMGAWVAAVFELSVCAGLITVVFISSVSLIKPLTDKEIKERTKSRIKKFIYLPFILVAVLVLLWFGWNNGFVPFKDIITGDNDGIDIGKAIWEHRQLDIYGQLIILLAGVFGVIILFKERGTK